MQTLITYESISDSSALRSLWSGVEFDWEFHEICAAGRLERLLESAAVAVGAWVDGELVGAVVVRVVEMAAGHLQGVVRLGVRGITGSGVLPAADVMPRTHFFREVSLTRN